MKIKVFKVSTKEMYTFKNKLELFQFVYNVTDRGSFDFTIDKLIELLPKSDYCRVR